MPLKILLTADIHLGLKFAGFPAVQKELTEARFETLSRVVALANTESCDLLVVAGDLFDHARIAERDIIRAALILNAFEGHLVAVLPGNHDFWTPGDPKPWRTFKSAARDTILFLEDPAVYPLRHYDLDAALYPGPCRTRHSSTNAVGWIRDHPKDPATKFHLGVAHGSLEGVSPDAGAQYFPMNAHELLDLSMDVWLLGHTDRLRYPLTPGPFDRIFFPGTPEPNGFPCTLQGECWIIAIQDDKSVEARAVSTGKYRFLHKEFSLLSDGDIAALKTWFDDPSLATSLVKLRLSGRLSAPERQDLSALLAGLCTRALYCETNTDEVRTTITPGTIRQEFSEGSFPFQLLTALAADEADRDALQVAYDLIREVRK